MCDLLTHWRKCERTTRIVPPEGPGTRERLEVWFACDLCGFRTERYEAAAMDDNRVVLALLILGSRHMTIHREDVGGNNGTACGSVAGRAIGRYLRQ